MASSRKTGWPIALIAAMLQVIVVLTLLPNSWMARVYERERVMLVDGLGKSAAEWVSAKGYGWYMTAFFNSGAVKKTYDLFVNDPGRTPDPTGFERGGKAWFQYMEGRLKAFWTAVAVMCCRLAMAMIWLPHSLILAVPAVLDGMMMWRVRREGFSFSSPVTHLYSIRAAKALMWLSVISLTVPIAIHPMLFPAFLVGAVLSLGIAAGSMPRRI